MTHSGIPPIRFASDGSPPEVLLERIRTSVASTRASTLDLRVRIALALGIAAGLATAAVALASQLVYHRYAGGLELAVRSVPYLVKVLLLLVALASIATWIALRRAPRGLGSGAVSLLLVSVLGAPLYAALVLASPVHFASMGSIDVPISPWGSRCLVIFSVVGAMVFAGFTLALRRSIPTGGGLRGAAIGTAAGAWAGLGVFAFCPSGGFQHVLIGHVAPILAFSLLGFALLPRPLRI